MEILLRVPVKSLLRFRCVSKTWCALVDCKDFVKRHLNHSIINKKHHNLIISDCCPWSHNLRTASLYSLDHSLDMVQPINTSFCSKSVLIGSCNGLLCLYYTYKYNYTEYDHGYMVVIWNPTTRKHVKLSNLVIERHSHVLDIVLGYNYSLSDDYKVVMLVESCSQIQAHVYSMTSNSWGKPIVLSGYETYKLKQPGAIACGALHWLMSKDAVFSGGPCLVTAFDLVTEEFEIVSLPDFHDNEVSILRASELGGCLSIVSCFHSDNGVFDVWVMKEYAVRQSWTKLFNFSAFKNKPLFDSYSVITLAYSESGDELLMLMVDYRELFWYNLEKRTLTFVVAGFDLSNSSRTSICLESLVSLAGQAENDYI